MARNQLPEGVGKKIVEALKRQAEADITPVTSSDNSLSSNISLSETKSLTEDNFSALVQPSLKETNEATFVVEDDNKVSTFDVEKMKEDVYNQSKAEKVQDENISSETPIFKAGSETTTITFNQTPSNSATLSYSGIPFSEEAKTTTIHSTVTISIPTNVAVLKNLIASLPAGVNKQMGAQIIRQTLEAMGIPMASVLKEAQEVQEELNSNTRECMLKIQELKTNIMQLEQTVQEYQKNITQINDLVSLFLLTDRK